MRLDDVAPRTLLLAGLAGWAVLAWAMAIAGMGGHLPERPPGAITTRPIPALPPPADGPALGPISQYSATAGRPLFATDRRPHPFSLQTESGTAQPEVATFDLVLTSVLITPRASMAIVQKPDGTAGWRVRVGESPESQPNWTLVRLEPRRAIFQGPEGQKELPLRVFDGKGGAPATSVASSADVDPPATMPGVGVVPPPPPPPASGAQPVQAAGAAPPTGVTGTPAPTRTPPADASASPDSAQIEAIRRRIEARREELRQRAGKTNDNPPATVAPPTEIR